MKQLGFTLKYLFRGRRHNIIKITSLTLGFTVGLVLFARVAFQMSYDTSYKDVDRLFVIKSNVTQNGSSYDYNYINAPVPAAFLHDLPEIESASIIKRSGECVFFYDNEKYTPITIFTDSLFFQTMGIDVIKGDERELGLPDKLFISDEYARLIFKDEDPVGKQFRYDKKHPYTIVGIYKAVPENTEMQHDVVCSFVNMKTQFEQSCDWFGDVNYWGVARFKQGVDVSKAEQKLQSVVSKYVSAEKVKELGVEKKYFFVHISKSFSWSNEIILMNLIMSVLALAILFTMAMNYVLISISSLASRAKMIGVHKCSGASENNIFRMFLSETFILFTMSFLCMILLLFAFRGQIEEMVMLPFSTLFTWDNLWLPMLVLLFIFLLTVGIPGRIFSKIPVTQVFQTFTSGRRGWKRVLLFVQFCGIAFVFVLFAVVLLQYNHLMNRDLGYSTDNIAFVRLSGIDTKEKYTALSAELNRIPYVEAMGLSERNIVDGYTARQIFDKEDNVLFNSYYTSFGTSYTGVMGIEFVAGHTVEKEGDLIVNETFAKRMGWDKENALGQTLSGKGKTWGTVVGVVKDFNVLLQVYTNPRGPLLIGWEDFIPNSVFTFRLTSLTSENLRELNSIMQGLYPEEYFNIEILTDHIQESLVYEKGFRDGVILASIVVFLITLMGLFGYIDDEVSRRRKEIAIRKINGATVAGVLSLFYKNMAYISVPAVILGVLGSSYASTSWLQQFPDKVPLNMAVFALCCLLLFSVIAICVLYKSWVIANANPVESIKTE